MESLFRGHSLGDALQFGHCSLEVAASCPSVTQLGAPWSTLDGGPVDVEPLASTDRGLGHCGQAAVEGQTSCRRRGKDAEAVTVIVWNASDREHR